MNSLQSSWVKRLYNDCFHEWKIIPLYLINKTFNPSFIFHSNISFKKSSFKKLLPFYRHMLNSWSQSLSGSPETSSQILSQFLWSNKYIKTEGTVIDFPKLSNKGINFLSQLFENRRIISWINLKDGYELTNNVFSVGSIETCNSFEMEKIFLITMTLMRTTYAKIITLSREIEFTS